MIILRPGCKINLGLRIRGRESDGFHSLSTFYYPLPFPADELRIISGKPGKLDIICDGAEIDFKSNLLFKAWERFGNATGIRRGYALILKKRIPTGAGLGGGSSDAATFLAFLNRAASRPLDRAAESRIAFSLGADVPFFLLDRPSFASGVGEKLVPTIFNAQSRWLVLVSPDICAGTAEVFGRWDELNPAGASSDACKKTTGTPGESQSAIGKCGLTKKSSPARRTISVSNVDLGNDLESAFFSLWPGLVALKEQLLALGAEKAAMSGSGSSFYGIFDCQKKAGLAASQLRKSWPRVYCLQLRDFGM